MKPSWIFVLVCLLLCTGQNYGSRVNSTRPDIRKLLNVFNNRYAQSLTTTTPATHKDEIENLSNVISDLSSSDVENMEALYQKLMDMEDKLEKRIH